MNVEKLRDLDNWQDFALCEEIEAKCKSWPDVAEIGLEPFEAQRYSPIHDVVSSLCASVESITLRNVAKMMGIDIKKLESDYENFIF